jgi:hypothetical protein
VEIAIPWDVLAQCAGRPAPPEPGHIWRVNFSRVQWHTSHENGAYEKVLDPETGKSLPEDNWVWSPQGLIAMHYPEQWGEVLFVSDEFDELYDGNLERALSGNPEHQAIMSGRQLMDLYYQQRQWQDRHGRFARTLEELGFTPPLMARDWDFEMSGDEDRFLARLRTPRFTITVNEEGRLVRSPLTAAGDH